MADLPQLPAPHKELARYISEHPEKSMIEIMEPYRRYEANLRSVYAQDRQNPILNDPHLNVLPLFTDDTHLITTRARDLETESEEEKSRYIMALPDDKRRPHGSPATVANLAEYQKNFNLFSESSLADMDWSNVVAAGSSVINCLLPVPKAFDTTKRKLREYYHEKFCPASDVDLFLYGLTHDQAIEKIKNIEQSIKDALLNEVTVVRTKYAITIASQYPVRHVQIVLRVYKSVSEILTGFDIDAAGGAYDGKQVYVTPRALGSFITQINHIDLSRRSPSYENRLSKYSHRNFEVYWPELDRERVDPTIFERSFQRTLGLARLLVLERLPTTGARETYLNKRRTERGRPAVNRGNRVVLHGNIKDYHEDEIADWLSEEDISNYHTFTVPYGQQFNAKRIEKLCYTRDLLLNAEWNQPDHREVYLHRHPAFFGRVQDVIEDCCGSCPEPVTPEEIEVAEKEAEIYISGKVSFLIDDPGRQQIGSFNPLTEQDWTDMAYVGNTARLCQSIVNGDIDDVLNWLSQEGSDPNKRDYTGRSPLHLAVMTSTSEVVKCLVDHGSRLTARLADGRTALHLAAARGELEMIKILMEKSIQNEEMEEERKDQRRKAAKAAKKENEDVEMKDRTSDSGSSSGEEESDGELIDDETTDADTASMTTASFVKVRKEEEDDQDDDIVPGESEDDPDYYQIDVLAWDVPCSPLHLAIVEGQEEAVKLLCDYGADSILPVKFLNSDSTDTAAILTLTLALTLPGDKAKSMAQLLLKLGATCSQGDPNGCTAFHRYIESGKMDLVEALWDNDKTGVKSAINHLVFEGSYWNTRATAPLHTAVDQGDPIMVLKLLEGGALPQIDFETWLKAAKVSPFMSERLENLESNQKKHRSSMEQPLILAVRNGNTGVAMKLLEQGADPNPLNKDAEDVIYNNYSWRTGQSALDIVRSSIKELSEYSGEAAPQKPVKTPGIDAYLSKFIEGTFSHWIVSNEIKSNLKSFKDDLKSYEKRKKEFEECKGNALKMEAIQETLKDFKVLEEAIVGRGGKTFKELYPNAKHNDEDNSGRAKSGEQDGPKPYEYVFSFSNDSDMTETRRDGYIELMEAAWAGDVEKIKTLCLQAWGPEQDRTPLKLAVFHSGGHSPFSVAFLREHYETASAILEMVKAQWSPVEKEKVRFKMETHDDDDEDGYSDEESDAESDDSEPRLVSHKVDQQFTVDNIGQVSMQVKSHTKPLDLINDNVPGVKAKKDRSYSEKYNMFIHAMEEDSTASLKALLDLAQHYSGQKFEGDDASDDESESSGKFNLDQYVFLWAIEHGRTQQLSLIIKRTGAGIPLDHLVKKSGVEMKKKPRYYQGLTVYGKKRNDWATAGRSMVVKTTGIKTPPLLHAALAGNIESVEFFLGDAPHRLYGEFGKSKAAREDSRLKHIKESPGGFDRAVSKWLGADNDLVMHCAVLANTSVAALELIEYLIEACPESLEKKNSQGDTPLMVACRLGRVKFAKALIEGNADQSVRNHKGENLLHVAVSCSPKAHQLRPLLDLLDPGLRSHLFLQRKNLHENGTTPLHSWIEKTSGAGMESQWYYRKPYDDEAEVVAMLKLLLEYSKGEELEMLNGAGDTCLHSAIMTNTLSLAQVLAEFQPRLLYRENAVGRTPAEVAHDRVTARKFVKPSGVRLQGTCRVNAKIGKSPKNYETEAAKEGKTLQQRKEYLVSLGVSSEYSDSDIPRILTSMGVGNKDDGTSGEDLSKLVMWDLCSTMMKKHPHNRRLVSLNEANDVARRLGEKYSASRYFSIQARDDDDEGEDKEEKEGEVTDFAVGQMTSRLRDFWVNDDSEKEDDE